MRKLSRIASGVILLMFCFLAAQNLPPQLQTSPEDERKLKRSQLEELLKQDYKKSREDAAQLLKLAEELKIDIEKSDRHVLSFSAIKKTEEIERIAKRMRGRMRKF